MGGGSGRVGAPPGCQGAAGSRGGQAGGELEGQGWGGWGGRGGSSVHARGRFSPLCPSPRQICPPGTVWSGGGGRRPGQQHSSRDTSEHGGEKCREGDEARGGSRQRLRESCHRPQHHSHGTRSLGGSVPTPGGGSSYLGRLLLLSSPPPRATKWGTLSCKGQRRVGCTVRSLLGQVFE